MADHQFSNEVLRGFIYFLKNVDGGVHYKRVLDELKVTDRWLNNKNNWHSADFFEDFVEKLRLEFQDDPEIIYKGAKYLYTESKLQRFTSLIGLLVTPKAIFTKLPEAASRMNLYNKFEFYLDRKKLGFSQGRVIQRYQDPKRKNLNAALCDSGRGSMEGILYALGYKAFNIKHPKCTKSGDEYCEFVFSWLNRSFVLEFAAWTTASLGGCYLLTQMTQLGLATNLTVSSLLSTVAVLILAQFRMRVHLQEAFDLQQDSYNDLRKASVQMEKMNKGLLKYQKELSQAMALATLGERSYSVAHDISNPVTIISGFAERLDATLQKNASTSEEALRHIEKIKKATKSLSTLTTVMRKTARSEKNEVTQINLTDTIRDLVSIFETSIRSADIELAVQMPDVEINMETYLGYSERIFMNLLQNAIKALKRHTHEHKAIFISVHPLDTEVKVIIEDTGPGIPPERLRNLWERFGVSQLNTEDINSGQQSTGFGLYHVKKMVAELGGTISVQSSHSGTTFSIQLPYKLAASQVAAG